MLGAKLCDGPLLELTHVDQNPSTCILVHVGQNSKSERSSGKALSGGVSCGVDRVGDTPPDRACDRGEAGKGPKPGGGPASRRCADGAMKRVPYARPLSPNDWGEGSGIWHQRK